MVWSRPATGVESEVARADHRSPIRRSSMDDQQRMHRLDAAIGLWMRYRRGHEPGTPQALLLRHPELVDLLEPMLAEDVAGAAPSSPSGAEPPAPELAADVRHLGDFELLHELGRGGMGVVYEARQLSLDRRVALKVLPAHLTLSPTSVARFKREAATAARLRHPSIVEIYSVGSAGDTHYFAMELIAGCPLVRWIGDLRAVLASRDQTARVVELGARVA